MNIVLKLCCKMLSVYGILVVSSIIWRTVSGLCFSWD
uniref:Uncharacterized protein n=1 Tax=Anguilla anguilla TaxID=7936 RepID=A0A0E9VFZ8_ANGAN